MGRVFTAHDASSEKRGLAALFQVIAGRGNRDATLAKPPLKLTAACELAIDSSIASRTKKSSLHLPLWAKSIR